MSSLVAHRNAVVLRFLVSLFALFCAHTASANRAAPARPNIIVILMDDMGYSDFSSYGGEIPTPNIDALADNGIRFTQFYNNARCSPTRAALLTGLNPHQAGMGHLSGMRLPESRGTFGRLHERAVTIAEVLRDAGYFTAMTGKWHLGRGARSTPWTRGFERSLSAVVGGIYFPDQEFERGKNEEGQTGRKPLFVDGRKIQLDDPIVGKNWYGTNLWADWGMRYIDEARATKRPFFLYIAQVAPHFPLMAPHEDIARFRGKFMSGWDALRTARFERQRAMGMFGPEAALSAPLGSTIRWDTLNAQDRTRFDHMMAIYAATIGRVDRSVGNIVAHLKKTGQFDNTLILILSDNGGNAESGPWGRTGRAPWGGPASNVFTGMNWAQLQNTPFKMFKHFTAEGGIATPLIAHWPKGIATHRRGSFEATPGQVLDIAPTVYSLAGADYPSAATGAAILPLEGVDLSPLFLGQTVSRGKPLFWEHEGNRAIRDGDWKAVKRFRFEWELYNIAADRSEMRDLAGAEPDRVKRMAGQWDQWATRTFVDPWQETERRTDWGGPLDAAAREAARPDASER